MRHRYLLSGLVLLLLAPAQAAELVRATPAEVGLSAERLDRIRAVLGEHVKQGRIAGAVALLARRGRVAFFESFGERDREADVAMTDDTIFRIASMSKPVTSVAVMMLYEEGHFLLNDPVSLYLPELGGLPVADGTAGGELATVPAERDMTIQDSTLR